MFHRRLLIVAMTASLAVLPPVHSGATNASSASPETTAAPVEGAIVAVPTSPSADPTNGNPFRLISARNAFGIKEPVVAPPPPPEVPPTPPPVPSNVTLTGFSLWQGRKKVYLQIAAPGSKAPSYRDMEEGDIQDDIEILSIDEKNEVAKIRNAGQEFTLNFKENAPKASVGAPPMQPGTPGVIPSPVTAGVANTGVIRQPGGGPTVIGRGGVVEGGDGGMGGAPNPNAGDVSGLGAPAAGILPGLPTRRARAEAAAAAPNSAPILQPGAPRIINGRTIPAPPPVPVLDVPAGE
jgi:hypothetical protein